MRRRSHNNNALKTIGLSSILAVGIGGLSYIAWQSMGKETADEFGCFDAAPQRQTVVLVDVSEPKFNEEQTRSLSLYFSQLYNKLRFNERLSVITTAEDQIGSIPKPRFHACGQATNAAQLEAINADTATSGFLVRQKERLYEHQFAPTITEILSPNTDSRQRYQSPILEMVQGIRRFHPLRPGDRLVIVSDLIQNSDSVQFCRTKNDMPPFSIFKKKPVYGRLKPKSLEGIDIEVLMIQRHGYGSSELSHCYSEEELRRFWREYLIASGASDPSFVRIRHGIIGE
ncbi:MAG: hypothetical protein KUG81_01500 [Gammaproteobacteria bacterium]|nr:hypothetical protein [Gammaproteobacteria bacterium]